MSWAKIPTEWMNAPSDVPNSLPPLASLRWVDHRATALAALLIFIGLAIRLNQFKKGSNPLESSEAAELVSVTYDELQSLSGSARATVAKALMLLESMSAIEIIKHGRRNIYRLPGIEKSGGWAQLPQSRLIATESDSLKIFKDLPKTKISLNAIKVYLVLIKFRQWKYNLVRLGYDGIIRYTGIRRNEVSSALGVLAALDLVRPIDDTEDFDEDQRTKRYKIIGLTKAQAKS